MPWGFAYAPRGPVARRLDARRDRRLHRGRAGTGCRPPPGRISHLRIDPEIEADGPLDPDGALAARPARRRLATGTADPAERDPDHRPARRRGGALGRPAQEVAPVRQQGTDRGDHRRRRGWRPARRVLPDLPRDRGPGRLPDPDRVRLPRRVGGVRARAAAPGCCSRRHPMASRRRRSSSCAAGPRVVEPYGGMTAAGGESRANYLLKWEAIRSSREAGATSYDLWGLATGGIAHFKTGFGGREVQLHRGVGPRPRPARPAGLRDRPARPGPVVAPARRGRDAAGARRRTGRPIEPSATRTPDELADWDARTVEAPGGHVYQSRAWADASRAARLAAAVPRR